MPPEPLDRLRRLLPRLPALGAEGDWLAAALARWLEPGPSVSFEACIGVAATGRAAHWRAVRDEALIGIAEFVAPGGSMLHQAVTTRSALVRYAAGRWARLDRHRPRPPAYHGLDRLLYAALHATGGRILSAATLRRLFDTAQFAQTP
jgi:hypothetical protein